MCNEEYLGLFTDALAIKDIFLRVLLTVATIFDRVLLIQDYTKALAMSKMLLPRVVCKRAVRVMNFRPGHILKGFEIIICYVWRPNAFSTTYSEKGNKRMAMTAAITNPCVPFNFKNGPADGIVRIQVDDTICVVTSETVKGEKLSSAGIPRKGSMTVEQNATRLIRVQHKV